MTILAEISSKNRLESITIDTTSMKKLSIKKPWLDLSIVSTFQIVKRRSTAAGSIQSSIISNIFVQWFISGHRVKKCGNCTAAVFEFKWQRFSTRRASHSITSVFSTSWVTSFSGSSSIEKLSLRWYVMNSDCARCSKLSFWRVDPPRERSSPSSPPPS